MTMFWLVVGLFLLGALLLLLPGLLRAPDDAVSTVGANLAVHRDEWREAERDRAAGQLSPAHFEQVRDELQRRVLDDAAPATPPAAAAQAHRPAWRTAAVLALAIPLASVLTYLKLGNPGAAAPGDNAVAAAPAAGDRHSITPEQIQKMVAALAERLQARPDDAEGWLMLGRSYTALGRYRDAVVALRKASDLLPGNATLLADLADVMGMAQNKRLAGEPARLVQQALDIDPRHVKALALAGSVAFEAHDYPAARAYWQRLLAVVPADAPLARAMQGSIAQATQLENGGAVSAGSGTAVPVDRTTATAAAADKETAATTGTAIEGEVVVDAALAGQVAAGDTLFVFARAVQGPRMPLAIVRRPAAGQPVRFTLDDTMAMSPQLKLSGFAQVVVGARISHSGNATPQPGDLVGQGEPVAPGARGLRIVIDRVQP